jgi:hypothetical protein
MNNNEALVKVDETKELHEEKIRNIDGTYRTIMRGPDGRIVSAGKKPRNAREFVDDVRRLLDSEEDITKIEPKTVHGKLVKNLIITALRKDVEEIGTAGVKAFEQVIKHSRIEKDLEEEANRGHDIKIVVVPPMQLEDPKIYKWEELDTPTPTKPAFLDAEVIEQNPPDNKDKSQ